MIRVFLVKQRVVDSSRRLAKELSPSPLSIRYVRRTLGGESEWWWPPSAPGDFGDTRR
ncbi:unnamed protein product [Acanthoscelides obtectus]|uniref:Uncharacterized protein n=1 Tax=Acanthoscelides obtectus TaxID=200917 RepID=A0A9P0KCK9_ACAOB|nr:unnamed protein product [Acanthoscelides obtectus]CAK1662509.1 hypothetical protein AOBTE_LOCUS23186 [Acanthoscelides obtectus]